MPQVPFNPIASIVRNKPRMPGAVDVIPEDVSFENQHSGEKIYVKARAHPFVNLGWVINLAFLIILPPIVFGLYLWIPFNFEITDFIPPLTIGIITITFYSAVFTNGFFNFIDWYYDIYLVTSERIINIQFSPLKTHRVSEAKLSDVEEVDESVVGFFPQMFNYGDVRASTAARRSFFVFKSIPNPAWFRDVITDLTRYLRNR